MFLPEHDGCIRGIVRDVMHALAGGGWGILSRGVDTLIFGRPGFTAVVGPENTCCRHTNPHAIGIFRVAQNGMGAQTAEPRNPAGATWVLIEAANRLPGLAAVAADK